MKIPPQAKRVFKGEIFDVYQWEQKMFDGSTAVFEMVKRPATIQIIPTMADKIILSYEQQPTKPATLTFLGGRQEPDEEPLESAKRELMEEAGLESGDWELIKTYDPEMKIDWTIYLYAARNCRKTAEPRLDPGERIETRPVDFDTFIETVSSDSFWGNDISNDFYRMKYDPARLERFRKTLFPG